MYQMHENHIDKFDTLFIEQGIILLCYVVLNVLLSSTKHEYGSRYIFKCSLQTLYDLETMIFL